MQICICVSSADQIKFLRNFRARLFVPNNSIRLTATCRKGTKTLIDHCLCEKHIEILFPLKKNFHVNNMGYAQYFVLFSLISFVYSSRRQFIPRPFIQKSFPKGKVVPTVNKVRTFS